MRIRWILLASLLITPHMLAQQADERTKLFPKLHFSYTLPEGWEWKPIPDDMPNLLISAWIPDRLAIVVTATPVEADDPQVLNTISVAKFEREYFVSQGVVRRAVGNSCKFGGIHAHQTMSSLGNTTQAARMTICFGHRYTAIVAGTQASKMPVEKLPEYEAAMDGFKFLDKPDVPDDEQAPWPLAAKIAGNALAVVVGIVIVWMTMKLNRRAKRRRRVRVRVKKRKADRQAQGQPPVPPKE